MPSTVPTAATLAEPPAPPAGTATTSARPTPRPAAGSKPVVRRSPAPQRLERLAEERAAALASLDTLAGERSEVLEAERQAAIVAARAAALLEAQRAAAAVARRVVGSSSAEWVLPTSNYRLTAEYGESSRHWATTHTGLDFAAPSGTPVVAVTDGTITFAESNGSYGLRVAVTDAEGTETWYCHLSAIHVEVGDTVARGTTIGEVGSTGNSTGPHLHFEVRPDGGDPVDPAVALAEHGVTP